MDTFDRIQKLLKRERMTQADLARGTGISTGLISQWKNRAQRPSAEKLQKVADYFHVSVDYLLGNEQKEKPLVNGDEELTEEILRLFKNLPPEGQKELLDYARYKVDHQSDK